METTPRSKLHPIVWVAAVSVTLFSLVGIGAITGLIPTADSKPEAPLAAPTQPAVQPAPPVAALAPAPAVQAEPAPTPAPAPKAATTERAAPKPAPRRVAEPKGWDEPPRAEETYRYRNAAQARVCKDCGTIESVREVRQQGEGSWMGPVAGGVVGGLLGNQVGKGNGKTVATVAGAVGGVFAGREVEKHVRGGSVFEVSVRMEDGSSRVLTLDREPVWRAGDRVRVSQNSIIPRD